MEIVTVTRRALQQRSGLDIEVVVGRPQVHRAEAFHLADYTLGMYASRDYLDAHGAPADLGELAQHPLVYFIDSMLLVDDLGRECLVATAAVRAVSGLGRRTAPAEDAGAVHGRLDLRRALRGLARDRAAIACA